MCFAIVVVIAGLAANSVRASNYVDALTATNDALIFAGADYGDFSVIRRSIDRLRHSATTSESDRQQAIALATQLDSLVLHAKSGDEIAWSAAGKLGVAIRGQVQAAETVGAVDEDLLLEFLLSQYLFRSLFGSFELAPELGRSMVSQDEKALLTHLQSGYPAPEGASKTAALGCVERSVMNLEADAVKVKPTPLVFLKCVRRLTE
jgi:hypothetical protein